MWDGVGRRNQSGGTQWKETSVRNEYHEAFDRRVISKKLYAIMNTTVWNIDVRQAKYAVAVIAQFVNDERTSLA